MPVDINEYALPTWLKVRERYPWVEERNYNYQQLTINPRTPVERYNGDPDARTGWKVPGYNVNHNSTRIERVNIGTDTTEQSFKPY
jgi:hypothetical protein